MTVVDEREYRFQTRAQWTAGARGNLTLDDGRLSAPDQLEIRAVPGAANRAVLPARDAYGRLLWLRPRSRRLVRLVPESPATIELGRLRGRAPARRLIAGRTVLWVLDDTGLQRYGMTTLQPLTPVEPEEDWRIQDITGDGGEGVWLSEAGPAGRCRLRHLDGWGCGDRAPITVSRLTVTSTSDGSNVVVIDPADTAVAEVAEVASGTVRIIGLDPAHRDGPTLLAAAPGHRIRLFTVLRDHALTQVVDLTKGGVEDQQRLRVPVRLGAPTALAGTVLACARGLAELVTRTGLADERVSTFITPALTSPIDPRARWNRAEIDVALPAGTAMEVTWASTGNPALVDRAEQLISGPATARLIDELDAVLPWRDDETVTYRGADPGTSEHLAALLDTIADTTLWLRIRFRTPPGRTSPELTGLRVRYPGASLLDELPAPYRENARSAAELRQLLAPYEILLDGLDETLTGLPGRIDPNTAGAGWSGYLLAWLGFPPLDDLPAATRSELLRHAAEILGRRGTTAGLDLLLDLITGGRATVTDAATTPAFWILGTDAVPIAGAAPARLGADTIALAQRPGPSRPGSMVLGETPLGIGCPDPELMLGHQAGLVTVTLALDPDTDRELRPILDRLLPVFVPAHCRVRVVRAGADGGRELDTGFRLAPGPDDHLRGDAHWRLGGTTRPGGWSLPDPPGPAAGLDDPEPLSRGPRLL
jgi:phage tail-like protein